MLLKKLREEVLEANLELVKRGLVGIEEVAEEFHLGGVAAHGRGKGSSRNRAQR